MPVIAFPAGNLHVGPLELHPYISTTEKYTDNIYFEPKGKDNDYITAITPGIELLLPFRMHKFSIEHNSTITRYTQYKDENTSDFYSTGSLDFNFGDQLALQLTKRYSKDHEPLGTSATGDIERYESDKNTAIMTYHLADISKVEIEFSGETWDFSSSSFRNRDEWAVSGYIYYKVLPKTSAFLEYNRMDVDYKNTSSDLNNKADSAGLGLRWEFTESSRGIIKGGYLWKDYEGQTKKDYDTWVASIDLNHDFTDYTGISIKDKREVRETKLEGTRYVVSSETFAELNHRFFTKVSGSIHGYHSAEKFSNAVGTETTERNDITIAGGAGLKYDFREWMELVFDYIHTERNSNIDENDYDDNSYIFTLNLIL